MNRVIVPIVEGHSEVQSLPVLLRRILHEQLNEYDLDIARPFRIHRTKVVKNGELERTIEQAITDRIGACSILLLLDADDDLPCQLGPVLLQRAKNSTDLPVVVVLANKEFESWLLGTIESLRGSCGIKDTATIPHEPEMIRGAKGRLTENMKHERHYAEVDDQPALTAKMDLNMASKNCPSFDKLIREVASLVAKIKANQTCN